MFKSEADRAIFVDGGCGQVAAAGGFLNIRLPLSRLQFSEGIHALALSGDLVKDWLRPSGSEWREPLDLGFDRAREPFRKEFHGDFVNAFLSVRPDSLENGSCFRAGS